MTDVDEMLEKLKLTKEQLYGATATIDDVVRLRSPFPAGGRYKKYIIFLEDITSLEAWAKGRTMVSVEYFIALAERMRTYNGKFSDSKIIDVVLTDDHKNTLRDIYQNLTHDQIKQMEMIEDKSEHDLAATTDWLKFVIDDMGIGLGNCLDGIHFGTTSEDVNYNVFALQNKEIFEKHLIPLLVEMQESMIKYAKEMDFVMAGLTHGQPAEPTTMSKKIMNIVSAIDKELQHFLPITIMPDGKGVHGPIKFYGKILGAVGNDNDVYAAYPDIEWLEFHRDFVRSLGLEPDDMVTQTGFFTDIRHYYDTVRSIGRLVNKLSNDHWDDISRQFFKKKKRGEGIKGSSVMPNKYNPWLLEGGVAYVSKGISMLNTTLDLLMGYRKEGDMARSILMRDIGDDFSKIFIGLRRILEEFQKYVPNHEKISEYLDANPGIVGAASQTILKRAKVEGDPYRMIQEIMIKADGSYVSRAEFEHSLRGMIESGKIPKDVGEEILYRSDPKNNIGDAPRLVGEAIQRAEQTLAALKRVYGFETKVDKAEVQKR